MEIRLPVQFNYIQVFLLNLKEIVRVKMLKTKALVRNNAVRELIWITFIKWADRKWRKLSWVPILCQCFITITYHFIELFFLRNNHFILLWQEHNRSLPPYHILSATDSIVNFRNNIVQQISRTCVAKTLYLLTNKGYKDAFLKTVLKKG
jgi:hypothetical protein